MKKAIYCYNIDDVDQHILETITAPMNIELGLLDDGMLKMTVEEILQRQPASNQDCTRFDISFMLMDELSDEEMKQILSAGEQAQWHFDPIKMFVTEHNRLWTMETLFGEVMKEHQMYAKAEQVAAILRRADQLDLKTWPAEQAERLNIALMKGYMLLKSGRFDEAQLDQTLSELTQAMGE